ncbi:STT3 domain-containing protein [Halorientalis regularis]|uniref:Dolichyl-diphosphooligosaccharide--protein glycosyltransferase n=1 Tax=Halorientalis regularis TaxID=660518 RepID=A0A1G7T388_9EURY|nr:STT3 domain-containing protein [Halorientalis regularis]SDG29786.1 dolichyl-diphosphooligosaccharide--protein glycosyltransferase [Halorientalis regularis]
MDDVREVTDSLLAEKPGLESDLEVLLEVDDDGPWTFDEIPLDSGTFGEVVSRGLVEEVDDGYRVADRAAVRAALDGEEIKTDSAETDSSIAVSLPDVDWRAVLALAGALALVAVTRVVFMWGSVFRGEHMVLAGNDPWGYRYYVEQMLAADLSPLAFGSLTEFLGTGLAQDHLYVVVAWWAAELLGGTPAAGLALAWLPVISALLTALLVYLLAARLTTDRRIGLASVLMLALTPVHANLTALGFGDHHAFYYLWLTLTAYALFVIATEYESAVLMRGDGRLPSSRATWAGAALLGIGIIAQSLARYSISRRRLRDPPRNLGRSHRVVPSVR